jgi:L-lactate dehydrogenase complex protein LldE
VVRVLERLGHTVDFLAGQTCCGQMHFNTGYQREALPLMRRMTEIFRGSEVVVSPSSSCVALIRDQYLKLAEEHGDAKLIAAVKEFVPKVYEFSELLIDKLGVEDVGAYYPHRVTYHASCHLLRGLKASDKQMRLLNKVKAITLVPLEDVEVCCGFGGTFSVKNADVSAAMLSDKMRAVLNTRAEVCTAGDNSCLMHIEGGLHRLRTGVRTVHLAEILASTESGDA